MKIVVTMTSWKGRINYVAKMIEYFFETQSDKPDLFYLWLAIPEFPNKENDLPKELLNVVNKYSVKLKWVEYNNGCIKRWNVYPEHFNDIVISIDDDTKYSNNLIAFAKKHSNSKYIITIGNSFLGLKRIYKNGIHRCDYEVKRYNYKIDIFPDIKNPFCGQCIIPPKMFPLECIDKDLINKSIEYKIFCDESLIMPFLIDKKTPCLCATNLVKDNQSEMTDELKSTALWRKYSKIEKLITIKEKLSKKDIIQYICLIVENKLDKWKETFRDYRTNEIEKYPIENLFEIIKK